ncbi:MAG: hypothetical protein JHC26_01960 [Thermofilum sp.]|jgi:hypothetical protein|uniref:hypothetical protein n=1 Tax=Thermofilum sp. TaxID=1961369 RepID=UPI0025864242|nr:hypothetical protein [Thermofilum sp.]MCI4407828.1 hypothetical protein [Thermofilum sp.]
MLDYDEKSIKTKACVATSYWVFRSLGEVGREIDLATEKNVRPDWDHIDMLVNRISKNMKHLKWCDENFPIEQVSRMLNRLKDAVESRDTSGVNDALTRIDGFLQDHYWHNLRTHIEIW